MIGGLQSVYSVTVTEYSRKVTEFSRNNTGFHGRCTAGSLFLRGFSDHRKDKKRK